MYKLTGEQGAFALKIYACASSAECARVQLRTTAMAACSGLDCVPAPLPTTNGTLWAETSEDANTVAVLMPWMAGHWLWDRSISCPPPSPDEAALHLATPSSAHCHVPLCPFRKGATGQEEWYHIASTASALSSALAQWEPPAELLAACGASPGLLGGAQPTPEGLQSCAEAFGAGFLPPAPPTANPTPAVPAEPDAPPAFSCCVWDLAAPWHSRAALAVLQATAAPDQPDVQVLLSYLSSGIVAWEAAVKALVDSGAPTGWVHGDLNDHNILVAGDFGEPLHVSAILDFDDMSHSLRVADLAILAAYAAMSAPDPIAAITAAAAGWHAAFPLTPREIAALPGLVIGRCAQSLIAAVSRCAGVAATSDGYLGIHAKPALALLSELLALPAHGIAQHLQLVLGEHELQAGEKQEREILVLPRLLPCGKVVQLPLTALSAPLVASQEAWEGDFAVWAADVPPSVLVLPLTEAAPASAPAAYGPIVPHPLTDTTVSPYDLAASAPEVLKAACGFHPAKVAAFTQETFRQVAAAGARVGWGRYGEDRVIYQSEHFTSSAPDAPPARSLHLGVDLMVAPHTPLFAPADGTLHSFAVNAAPLDYGPAVVLAHDGGGWFSLYGHCSPRTWQLWEARVAAEMAGGHLAPAATPAPHKGLRVLKGSVSVQQGDLIGWVGEAPTNGGWGPHLHFQVMSVDPWTHSAKAGDFAGVCQLAAWETTWGKWVPDPSIVLGWAPPSTAGPAASSGGAAGQ